MTPALMKLRELGFVVAKVEAGMRRFCEEDFCSKIAEWIIAGSYSCDGHKEDVAERILAYAA